MKLLIFSLLFAFIHANDEYSISVSRLNRIADIVNNDKSSTWKAVKYPSDSPFLENAFRIGVLESADAPLDANLGKGDEATNCENNGLPKNFDTRKHWPKCRSITGHVYDQGNCGSCWAVSVASAFTDRVCIASDGKIKAPYSGQQLTSCCTRCFGKNGCNGGWPTTAWNYIKRHGLVTGGDYNSNEGCQPYAIKHCDHHVNGTYRLCSDSPAEQAPKCQRQCNNKYYSRSYKSDKIKAKAYYDIAPCAAQNDIYEYGTIIATFTVYEDFFAYKSGVYQHTSGERVGRHAVRVIGWGEENYVPYWLAVNSWNTHWGDEGTFKIKRGDNEVWFEEEFSAAVPNV